MVKKIWIPTGLAACVAISAAIGAAADRPERAPKTPVRPDEARIMKVIDKLTPTIRPMLNVPPEDGQLLRVLAESSGAKHAVEIGTSNGYSALWTSLALKNTGGKLVTFDIDEKKVKLARENFKEAGVDSFVTVIHGDAHQEVTKLKGPLDFVFIDADKPGYLDYYKKLLPLLRPGGLILAHNTTSSSRDLKDFVEAITTDPNVQTVFWNVSDRGMSVTMKKHPAK